MCPCCQLRIRLERAILSNGSPRSSQTSAVEFQRQHVTRRVLSFVDDWTLVQRFG